MFDSIPSMIDNLQCAIQVCNDVDSTSEDNEKSYPYATGYSRSAMMSVVEQLQTLQNILENHHGN
tara:strand:- start:950 stop:1144 length:195 start_codon:yes stop_codon:yes gene_type:complete